MAAILGISAFYHDSAAALVVDGRVVAAAQEERFTRIKHDPAFPARAIEYLPARGRTVAGRAGLRGVLRQAADQVRAAARDLPGLCARRVPQLPAGHAVVARRTSCTCVGPSATAWAVPTRARLVFTDHHESHAASAFFPSPFDEAAILTLDGVGEWTTAAFGVGEGNRIRLIDHVAVPPLAGPACTRRSPTTAASRSTAANTS